VARVELVNVQKSYGTTRVLERVDLDVADGEYIVLLGRSGCGKSTLLRCIAGLEAITAGDLRIGDRRMNDVSPRDRDVAMVFQSYALYPHMTVRENMAFALTIRGRPAAEIDAAVGEAAQLLELGALLDRKPAQLSGGQRQRVAMGRAIVRRPAVFLFDEPLSNLDAALRGHMRVELKRLHRRLGATIVHVTHDQIEAMTLADRMVILDRGVVQQIGSPAEVYDAPANTFVATFIGAPAMNLLPDGDGTLGVRPADVRIGEGSRDAVVDVVEGLGDESIVHLDSGGQRLIARMAGAASVRSGERVRVDFTRVHRFGADGRRR
jgi:ABC-type sugar transport system ATPase subunit